MSTTPPVTKPRCPECNTELILVNNELPEECAACHFVLAGWEPFLRWFKLAQKLVKEQEPAPPQPRQKRSPLQNLLRR